MGAYLAGTLDFPIRFALRPVDQGELLVCLIVGLSFLIPLAALYLHQERQEKIISLQLVLLIAFLAFFGIVVDLLHIAIKNSRALTGLIEDGGEMVVMSAIFAYLRYRYLQARSSS